MPREISILVVDDDRDVCEYVELLLTQAGYCVDTQTDSTFALSQIRDSEYHVVLLDVMMPKLSGMELLEEIRGYDSDLAVIVFTGHPSVDTAVKSLHLKASDYLKKPFDGEELTTKLEDVLRTRGLLIDPEEALLQTIGDNIREARKRQNLTLKQMSNRTGLSVSLLSQIERAESSASVSSLYKIARALECPVTSFFGKY